MDTPARHGDECGDGDIFETPWVGSHQCVDGAGAAGVPHLQQAPREKTAQRERGNRNAMTAMGRRMTRESVVCCGAVKGRPKP
mmetsp:Transcript_41533/g.103663  ORF Transcript_41533/g.103663 Transcript_41533/m.103663 type:complete len:83 (-) Transcript_41533:1348-1596(-)